MRPTARRAATLALAAVAVAAVHGCSERLEGGAACPILCPGQTVELRDTLVAGVALDTVLGSFPAIGDEDSLVLAWRGDTLETRIIVRYDTLPSAFAPPSAPTTTVPIEAIDSARLRIRLVIPVDEARLQQSMTIEAYDVDTSGADGTAADTAEATMLPLFRPDRFLGTITFTPAQIRDTQDSTVRIPIDANYLLAKVQAKSRLRVGLLLRSSESAELYFYGVTKGRPPPIAIHVSSGESDVEVLAQPYSATPAERFIANSLSDFLIVAQRRAPDVPPEVLTVGGVPGRRAYLRFELPSGIVDSTSVVRATLILTQYPNRLAFRPADTISLYPQPVVASGLITDLHQAARMLGGLGGVFRLDSLRTAPDDSGQVEIEVGGVVQIWRATEPDEATRALVLRLPTEGVGQEELYFFSTEADEALRPRLRIVYVPRIGFGLP